MWLYIKVGILKVKHHDVITLLEERVDILQGYLKMLRQDLSV